MSFKWKISSSKRKELTKLFNQINPDNDKMSGDVAKEIFIKSNVSQSDLAKIWSLADRDNDGCLTSEEFMLASFLIYGKVSGQEIPDELPKELIESTKESKWHLDRSLKETFAKISDQGTITGEKAFEMFSKVGLKKEILAKIWSLSDLDGDGQLNEVEFFIASKLISVALEGSSFPEYLPKQLLKNAQQLHHQDGKNETKLDTSLLDEVEVKNLMQKLQQPINNPSLHELASKYNTAEEIIQSYHSNELIQRVQQEITNVEIAKKVLEQSDPDLRAIRLTLEKERALTETLNAKKSAIEKHIQLTKERNEELIKLMKEYAAQADQLDKNRTSCIEEIVRIEAGILSLKNEMNKGGGSNVTNQIMQIQKETASYQSKLEQKRKIKEKLEANIKKLTEDMERINQSN